MNVKTFLAPLELKGDGKTGEFSAVFATLNVVDHDGDVTVPGAFPAGREVVIEPWNHDRGLPVGRATIREDEEKAWVDGRFFLDTAGGREHYETVKGLGPLTEWSYTFRIEESDTETRDGAQVRMLRALDVVGVGPVTRGAGIGTRTEAIKGEKSAFGSHSTPTTDAAWDGPANEARARSGEDVAYYRRIYAWRDPEGDPAVKSSYKFVHHMVDGDGNPGAANVRACQTGIGVLNGGRGGTTIPEGDRRGVWNHLAGHLRDADLEPPELKALSSAEGAEDDGDGGHEGQGGESVEPSGDLLAQIDILELSLIIQGAEVGNG